MFQGGHIREVMFELDFEGFKTAEDMRKRKEHIKAP